jgi:hypothetical protein
VSIRPYTAVGLVTTVWGIRHRSEIRRNIDHISHVIAAASWLSSLDLPVRLVAVPEGALQGFTDEVFDMDHEDVTRASAPSTSRRGDEALGRWRRVERVPHGSGQGAAPGVPGPVLQRGFVIDPRAVILKHHKVATLYPVEHSVTPHDVWDRWVELYGDARRLLPVADTEIGGSAIMMANEGRTRRTRAGLAMNGAEVSTGPRIHTRTPATSTSRSRTAPGPGQQLLRGGPNLATYYLSRTRTPDRHVRRPLDDRGLQGPIVGGTLYGAGPRTWPAWWTSRPSATTGPGPSGTTG